MQNEWTVIVDDDCGTTKVYVVCAKTPNQAVAFAERIFNAHSSMGGRVQYVLEGRVLLYPHSGQTMPTPIDLMLTAEEQGVI